MGHTASSHEILQFMIRLLLKAGFPLTLLFSAAIVLVRAQPYDDPDFEIYIHSSADCSSPCFLGIRPGVTTLDEALAALQGHQWVETVLTGAPDSRASQTVYWHWRDDAPSFLKFNKLRDGGTLHVTQGIVQSIDVTTGIRLGTAWLHWGAPEQYTSLAQTGGPINGPTPPRPLTYVYDNIILISWTPCSAFNRFWEAKIEIIYGDPEAWLQTVIPHPSLPGTTPVNRFVRDVKTNFCP